MPPANEVWGKVIFLLASVILSRGAGLLREGVSVWGGGGVSVTVTYGTVKSGRYTTYWNAFLFEKEISDHTNKTSRILNGADSA